MLGFEHVHKLRRRLPGAAGEELNGPAAFGRLEDTLGGGGSFISAHTVIAAGSFTRTFSTQFLRALSQQAQPSLHSREEASVTWGMSRKAATAAPTWAVSPSAECWPKSSRSKLPSFLTAWESV